MRFFDAAPRSRGLALLTVLLVYSTGFALGQTEATVIGRVLNSDNQPLPNTRLQIIESDSDRVLYVGTTNADGEIRYQVRERSRVHLRSEILRHDAYSDPVTVTGTTTLTLQTVSAGVRLRNADGSPYRGAYVNVRNGNDNAGYRTRTDSDGIARFEVYPGTTVFFYNDRAGNRGTTPLTRIPADTLVTLQAVPLIARALDGDGNPLNSQTVLFYSDTNQYLGQKRTDNAGEAVLDVYPGFGYTATLRRYDVDLPAAETVTSGSGAVLRLNLTAITGELLGADGSPVPGQSLKLFTENNDATLASATTDAQGRVRFHVAPGQYYGFRVQRFQRWGESNRVQAGDGTPMRVQFVTIETEFLRADGTPHPAGVSVALHPESGSGFLGRTDTDGNGVAAFEVLPGFDYTSSISHLRATAVSTPVTAGNGQNMRLQTTRLLGEYLRSDGAPHTESAVFELWTNGPVNTGAAATTDSSGRVAFEVFPGHGYHARLDIFNQTVLTNSVTSGNGNLMRLQTQRAEARFLQSDGTPHVGRPLILKREGYTAVIANLTTDAEGHAAAEVPPNQRYVVTSQRYFHSATSNAALAGSGDTLNLQTVALYGRMRNPDGSGLAGQRLILYSYNQNAPGWVVTNAQGLAKWEVFPGKNYFFRTDIQGRTLSSNTVASGSGGIMEITTAALRARVLNADGSPFSNARLYLEHNGTVTDSATTNSEGYADFEGSPGADYNVRMQYYGAIGRSNTVAAGAGELMQIQLRRFEARVLDADGNPMPAQHLHLLADGEQTTALETTNNNGIAGLDLLPGATYGWRHRINDSEKTIVAGSIDEQVLFQVGRIIGRLRTSQNQPHTGRAITLYRDNTTLGRSKSVDGNGEAAFDLYPGFPYQISTNINGTRAVSEQAESSNGLILTLQTVSVGAQVYDQDGNRIQATVYLGHENSVNIEASGVTDSQGVVDFEVFPGDTMVLRLAVNNATIGSDTLTTTDIQPLARKRVLLVPGRVQDTWLNLTPFHQTVAADGRHTASWFYAGTGGVQQFTLQRGTDDVFAQVHQEDADTTARNYRFEDPDTGNGASIAYKVLPVYEAVVPCEPATNLRTVAVTSTTVDLAWDASSDAVRYHVRYRIGEDGWVQTPSVTGTGYRLENLTPGTDYEWMLRTVCLGNWVYTQTADFATQAGCNPPPMVTLVDATDTTLTVAWPSASSATAYRVEYQIGQFVLFDEVAAAAGTSQQHTLDRLSRDTTYTIRIRSICAGGQQSDATSLPLQATTDAESLLAGYTPDSFAVSPTGQANYSIPLRVPHALGGITPGLQFTYNSSAGNGPMGLGWTLQGFSGITRQSPNLDRDGFTDRINYDNRDFFALDGQTLLPINDGANGANGTEYRTELASDLKIVSHGNSRNAPTRFEVTDENGVVRIYGRDADAIIETPDRTAVSMWVLKEVRDIVGNTMTYHYREEYGQAHAERIDFASNSATAATAQAPFNVQIHYENRPDTTFAFIKGEPATTEERIRAVSVHYGNEMIRRYDINYAPITSSTPSRVGSIVESNADGARMPIIHFEWDTDTGFFREDEIDQGQDPTELSDHWAGIYHRQGRIRFGDFNGDGLIDTYFMRGYEFKESASCVSDEIYLGDGQGGYSDIIHGVGSRVSNIPAHYDPIGLDRDSMRRNFLRTGDFNGDGLTDLLLLNGHEDPTGMDVGVHLSNGDGTYRRRLNEGPALHNTDDYLARAALDGTRLADVNGDGRTDLIYLRTPAAGSIYYADIYLADADGNLRRDWARTTTLEAPGSTGEAKLRAVRLTHLADFDGNGLIDIFHGQAAILYLQTRDGWQPVDTMALTLSGADSDAKIHSASRYKIGDFNGDGKHDLYLIRGDRNGGDPDHDLVFLSHGDGTFTEIEGPETPIDGDTADTLARDLARVRFIDMNSDGTTDVYYVNNGNGNQVDSIFLFDALGEHNRRPGYASKVQAEDPIQAMVEINALRLVDISGNAFPDIVQSYGRDGDTQVRFNRHRTPLLTRIAHENGASRTIEYSNLNDRDIYDISRPRETAAEPRRIFIDGTPFDWRNCWLYDGQGNFANQRGSYTDGGVSTNRVYSVVDNMWRTLDLSEGKDWANAPVVGPAFDNGTTDMRVPASGYPATYFIGPMTVVASTTADDGGDHRNTQSYGYEQARAHRAGYGFLGFKQVTIHDDAHKTVVTHQYGLAPNGRFGGFLVSGTTNVNGSRALHFTNRYQWHLRDGVSYLGNLTYSKRTEIEPRDGTVLRETITDADYNAVGHPVTIVRTVRNPAKPEQTLTYRTENLWRENAVWPRVQLRERRETIEETTGATTRTERWTYDADGLQETHTALAGTAYQVTKHFEFDAFGNRTHTRVTATGETPRTTSQTYDNLGLYLATRTNSLGHTVHTDYDPRWGTLTATTDVNGETTRYEHNGSGAIITTIDPRGNQTRGTAAVAGQGPYPETAPALGRYYLLTQYPGGGESLEWFDALDRRIREAKRGFDGRWIYRDQRFNATGHIEAVSRAYHPGETPVWETRAYDDHGRLAAVTAPDGVVTQYETQGSNHWVIRNAGRTDITEQRETDLAGRTIAVTNHAGETLRFRYQRLSDRMIRTAEDPAGNQTVTVTNVQGKTIRWEDPAMGLLEMTYNAFGERVTRRDALGRETRYHYDGLGRLTEQHNGDGVTTRTYDTAANGIGRLAQVTGPDGYLEERAYTPFGELARKTVRLNSQSYTVEKSFDTLGRLERLVYPSGYTLAYGFNSHGYQNRIFEPDNESRPLWNLTALNAAGQTTETVFGNGVTTRMDYLPKTGLLSRIEADHNGTQIQHLGYRYNALRHLDEQENRVVGAYEALEYDELQRLIGVENVNEEDEMELSLEYDSLGNITYKSDVGDYRYEAGAPHAVTAAGNHRYRYDAMGRMVERRTGDAVETIRYNAADMPIEILAADGSKRLQFTYDPDGMRYRQLRTVNGITTDIHYVDNLYENRRAAGGNEQIHYIFAGSQRIAVHTQTETNSHTRYLHVDRLGSLDAVTDENGDVVERHSFDAFGRRRKGNWAPATEDTTQPRINRGYTGHEMLDAFDLIHMNGRVYDPVIGRFMTPDPIRQFPYHLQGVNPYSYILNNPYNATDPSGHFFVGLAKFALWLGKATTTTAQIITAVSVGVVGAAAVAIYTHRTGGEWEQGAIKGFALGVSLSVTWFNLKAAKAVKRAANERAQETIQNLKMRRPPPGTAMPIPRNPTEPPKMSANLEYIDPATRAKDIDLELWPPEPPYSSLTFDSSAKASLIEPEPWVADTPEIAYHEKAVTAVEEVNVDTLDVEPEFPTPIAYNPTNGGGRTADSTYHSPFKRQMSLPRSSTGKFSGWGGSQNILAFDELWNYNSSINLWDFDSINANFQTQAGRIITWWEGVQEWWGEFQRTHPINGY
ncbi:SpvB/TcaC N-terminal domain-containing protein [Acanthopleuribacter pedis]|uniref:VCBS repeat-containing protein n=1 Tax=Acanthopleuribacter pedis TaxID=442870 RepID=A0A8J7U456_9BACT|nr:SpvB/TcaC N-terminal domain-containing protein [Acanthopleuribacter pedis]MBO1319469.1 VCBS repeat-containing protein [Acanthopleuribacter pedis]